jgi:hypothetical protein
MNREQAVRKISSATTRMVAGINQAVLSGKVCLFVFFFLYFPFFIFQNHDIIITLTKTFLVHKISIIYLLYMHNSIYWGEVN